MKTAHQLVEQIIKDSKMTLHLALQEAYNEGFTKGNKVANPVNNQAANSKQHDVTKIVNVLEALQSLKASTVTPIAHVTDDEPEPAQTISEPAVTVIDALDIDDTIKAMIEATQREAEYQALQQAAAEPYDEDQVEDDIQIADEPEYQPAQFEHELTVPQYKKTTHVDTDESKGIMAYEDRLTELSDINQINVSRLKDLYKQVDDRQVKDAIRYIGASNNMDGSPSDFDLRVMLHDEVSQRLRKYRSKYSVKFYELTFVIDDNVPTNGVDWVGAKDTFEELLSSNDLHGFGVQQIVPYLIQGWPTLIHQIKAVIWTLEDAFPFEQLNEFMDTHNVTLQDDMVQSTILRIKSPTAFEQVMTDMFAVPYAVTVVTDEAVYLDKDSFGAPDLIQWVVRMYQDFDESFKHLLVKFGDGRKTMKKYIGGLIANVDSSGVKEYMDTMSDFVEEYGQTAPVEVELQFPFRDIGSDSDDQAEDDDGIVEGDELTVDMPQQEPEDPEFDGDYAYEAASGEDADSETDSEESEEYVEQDDQAEDESEAWDSADEWDDEVEE